MAGAVELDAYGLAKVCAGKGVRDEVVDDAFRGLLPGDKERLGVEQLVLATIGVGYFPLAPGDKIVGSTGDCRFDGFGMFFLCYHLFHHFFHIIFHIFC